MVQISVDQFHLNFFVTIILQETFVYLAIHQFYTLRSIETGIIHILPRV